jgi:HEAT repeat protein
MWLLLTVCLLIADDDCPIKDPHVRELAQKIDKGGTTASIEAMNEAAKLGAAAKPLLPRIVNAMTSHQKDVRKSAYEALHTLDDNLYNLATKLILAPDQVNLDEVDRQGPDVVIPLAPLLARLVEEMLNDKHAPEFSPKLLNSERSLMLLIEHAPDDPSTRKAVLKSLKSPLPGFQYRGCMCSKRIKNGQEAMPDVIRIARVATQENVKIEAIHTATDLADDKSKPAVVKMLYDLRRDKNENIRREVEEALGKLKEK